MSREGDVSRKRRLTGPIAKVEWYARSRSFRFCKSDFKPHHGCQCLWRIEVELQVQKFKDILSETKKCDFSIPFPMGVFGTLRRGCGNHRLMHGGKFDAIKMAFLPNFVANGLWLYYSKGSAAPFEIYSYSKEEWNKMIPSVDRLEGFDPNDDRYHGYMRTLVWMHILPENYEHDLFATNKPQLSASRDLKIAENDWNKFEKVPCWIYSNTEANQKIKEDTGYPVIWG